ISGEMFDFIPPVPNPITIIDTINPGSATPAEIAGGIEVNSSISNPII
ncbi:unnamed protein product, partial [Rotaria sordida]